MPEIEWHSWVDDDLAPCPTGIWAQRSQVMAALAERDARIAELESAMKEIACYKLTDLWLLDLNHREAVELARKLVPREDQQNGTV